MLHTLTTCLTAFTVLACPLWCFSDGACDCAAAPEVETTVARCTCCSEKCPNEEPEGGVEFLKSDLAGPSDHPGGCGGHCFCKGAVLDHGSMDASILVVFHSLPAVIAAIESPLVIAGAGGFTDESLCPSGLCARIVLCSLQR